MMKPGGIGPLLKLKGEWPRYWLLTDVEGLSKRADGLLAVGAVVLDLTTGRFIPSGDFFVAIDPVEESDPDTLKWWEQFPALRAFLAKRGVPRADAVQKLVAYYKQLGRLVGDESWTFSADNP